MTCSCCAVASTNRSLASTSHGFGKPLVLTSKASIQQSIPSRGRRPQRYVLTRAFFAGLFGGGSSKGGSCATCGGKGAVRCKGCKGTGRNKSNGNMFERWKCYDCQGFGLVSCSKCGRGGLTPEQRGER